MGLIPIPVFDEFFIILVETPLKKAHKYGALISFFLKSRRQNWRKLAKIGDWNQSPYAQ
jgi:hypothetical protein